MAYFIDGNKEINILYDQELGTPIASVLAEDRDTQVIREWDTYW